MKRTLLYTITLLCGCGVIYGLTEKSKHGPLTPKLSIDRSLPEREGPLGGFAGIVEAVSPSVVSIFTSREALQGNVGAPGLPPELFNAPGLREFFGNRGLVPRNSRPQAPSRLPKEKGLGSGVILSADGYVLTNNHVVERASDIRVSLTSGREYGAEIVATDPGSDLAVIKVDATGLPAAVIGDSEALRAGDLVLAIGSPFGLSHTVTHGIVSATGRDNLNIAGYENFIQTDASINPGNSGGALIDNKGRVIGINTAIFSRSGGNVGIGFAIPINMAVEIAEELIDKGEISRGYLGVSLGRLSKSLAEALGVEAKGVVVNDVMPDTPAEMAGFKAGDVIVSVNGKVVNDVADVRRLVGREKPGATVSFGVHRADEELSLNARIATMPAELIAGAPVEGNLDGPGKGALAGVRLGAINSATRERLGLDSKIDGVVVLEVAPDSEAAEAGLRPGEVITRVNRADVSSPREAYEEAKSSDGKPTLLRVTDGKNNHFVAIG